MRISVRLAAVGAALLTATLGLPAAPVGAATSRDMARPVSPRFRIGHLYTIADYHHNFFNWDRHAGGQLREYPAGTKPHDDVLFKTIRSKRSIGERFYQFAAVKDNGAVSKYCITVAVSARKIVMDKCAKDNTKQYWWWATSGVPQIDVVYCLYTNPHKPRGGNHPIWWVERNGNGRRIYSRYSVIYNPQDQWYFTYIPNP